jgi:hypothetical protein
MRSRSVRAVCILLLVLLPGTMDGLALRCGTELVREGDIRSEVLAKCGEPTDRTLYYEEREIGRITRIVPIEVWIYNFGAQTFVHFLTFENGKLVGIQTGGYGY